MGSHSVTCHPTQVNSPHHNRSQCGRYSIYQPWRDRRLSNSVSANDSSWTAGGTQLKTTGGGQMEEVAVKREKAIGPGNMAGFVSSSQQGSLEEGYCEISKYIGQYVRFSSVSQ